MAVRKVCIIVKGDAWVLQRYAREIEKRLDYTWVSETPNPDVAINYYISYGYFLNKSKFDICFFTHFEPTLPYFVPWWERSAKLCDIAVSMSDRYAELLYEQGAKDVRVIVPGVDTAIFKPETVVGVVGRTYPNTGRKGEKMVAQLMEELPPEVTFRFVGRGWPGKCRMRGYEQMPRFYSSLDVLLVASTYEGGPMPVPEALACGIPVIAPEVGFVPLFPHISYEVGDVKTAKEAILGVHEKKLELWRMIDKDYSWDVWARKHDELFKEVMGE